MRRIFLQNYSSNLPKITLFISFFVFLFINFYIFSRFTVDDAFITWRHAANFIETGYWSYNPTDLDKTLSYTNTLYALLSFLPLMLKIDIVLFFKMFAILILLGYLIITYKISKGNLLAISSYWSIVIFPISSFHIYSGLETFLYVFLVPMLFICLMKDRKLTAISIAILLTVIRPEAYLLAMFIPFLIYEKRTNFIGFSYKESLLIIIVLLFLISQFFFNYINTGFVFPNTYYAKESFSLDSLRSLWFFPLLLIFSMPIIFTKKKKKIMAAFLLFNSLVFGQYLLSILTMDYQYRFLFHLLIPTMILSTYVIHNDMVESELISKLKKRFNLSYLEKNIPTSYLLMIIFTLGLGSIFSNNSGTISDINYYPRLLNSHAYTGTVIKSLSDHADENIVTAQFDAGIFAYNSQKVNLDIIGLGSTYVAHNYTDQEIIEKYNPNIIFIRDYEKDSLLFKFAIEKEMDNVCSLYFKNEYVFNIYTNLKNITPLEKACEKSKTNKLNERDFFMSTIYNPPWFYWKTHKN